MKHILIALVLIAAWSVWPANAAEVGRYQLVVGGYYYVPSNADAVWVRSLFKIDTVTGIIYRCETREMFVDDKLASKFKELAPYEGKRVKATQCNRWDGEIIPSW